MRGGRWWLAGALGTLHTVSLVLALGELRVFVLERALWVGPLFLAALTAAAHWTIAAVDTLRHTSARDAAAVIVRGTMAGSLVCGVGSALFALGGPEGILLVAAFGAFAGLFVGLFWSVMDIVILGAIRLLWPSPAPA